MEAEMAQDVPVIIEVAAIAGGRAKCKGRAKTALGDEHEVHILTPQGLCARAFAALYPYILAMRYAPELSFGRKETVGISCPDGDVTFHLRRKDDV